MRGREGGRVCCFAPAFCPSRLHSDNAFPFIDLSETAHTIRPACFAGGYKQFRTTAASRRPPRDARCLRRQSPDVSTVSTFPMSSPAPPTRRPSAPPPLPFFPSPPPPSHPLAPSRTLSRSCSIPMREFSRCAPTAHFFRLSSISQGEDGAEGANEAAPFVPARAAQEVSITDLVQEALQVDRLVGQGRRSTRAA